MVSCCSKGESASDADNSSGDAPESESKSLFSEGEKLVKLPRSPNVDDILTKYLEHRSKKDGKNIVGTPNFAHENHATKKQTPDGGKSTKILTVNKPSNETHKTRTGIVSSSSSFCPASAKSAFKEDRKMYVREPASEPFVSMAEMMKKFQSGAREMSLPRNSCSLYQSDAGGAMHRKPKLTLTTPKTPEFETSQRVRSVKIKSSAEIEEEMMAKIPKFKARPLNKKLVKLPRSPNVDILTKHLEHISKRDGMNIVGTPNFAHENLATKKQTPDGGKSKQTHKTRTGIVSSSPSFCPASAKSAFKEDKEDRKMYVREPAAAPFVSMAEMMKKFQPGTREMSLPRNSCSLYQSDAGGAMHRKSKLTLTTPKTPEFETSQRVRSVKIKSSAEIEEEMMAKIPKFKARPLNKKIFEASALPLLPRSIPHPPEFKLSCSESQREKHFPRNTTPNPFHLHTEERGAEKERRVAEELMQKQYEEKRSRVPMANPYPYTTDYPVFPPKPEPKPRTRPEPFQLESLLRHEQEMQREMEERRRMEMEEAEMRKFKAQPIFQEDPIPLPVKERRPLTKVQEFNLLVENRAVKRSKFDMKIKEKEMAYQRYREEKEAAKMMEEEKVLKQLRRTLVHHARPVPRFDHPFLQQKYFFSRCSNRFG